MTMRETLEALRLHRGFAEDFFLRRSQSYGGRARVDYGALVRTLLATGSYTRTAEQCGVTAERVRQLTVQAMRHLRKLGKLPPLAALILERSARVDDKVSRRARHPGAAERVSTSEARSTQTRNTSPGSDQISLRELRQHPLRILARIAPSQTVQVMHRGRVIGLLTKAIAHDPADTERQKLGNPDAHAGVDTRPASPWKSGPSGTERNARSISLEWSDELSDPREDIYSVDDGDPID